MSGLDQALAQIGDWPVDHVGAAVVDANGVRAMAGEVDRPFPLASVTKPLTALAVLVAVEEGAIELTDAIATDIVDGASVRHLLSHAGGLAMDRPVRAAEPGTRRIYSNIGIDRLAQAVSAATGIDFEDYFREAVAQPLGLHTTTVGARPSRDGVSTVRDLTRVMTELLAPTGLLSAPMLADARAVQFPGLSGVVPGYGRQDPNDWGLGFEIRDHKSPHWTGTANSPATFGHFGQAGTMVWIDPVAGLGLVALTDCAFDQWAIQAWPRLADAVLAGSV